MKNVRFLFLFAVLFIVSCKKQPQASFSVDKQSPTLGEAIQLTNLSVDGLSYSWDFGDGTSSTDEHPTHTYAAEGVYTVKLTAYSKKEKKMDDFSMVITVQSTHTKLLGLWNFDTGIENTYKNGALESSTTTDFTTLFSYATIDFKSDYTSITSIDGFGQIGSTWAVLVEGKTLLLTADTVQIMALTSNAFETVQVETYSNGADNYLDSNFTLLSR